MLSTDTSGLIDKAFQLGVPFVLLVGFCVAGYRILRPMADRLLEGHLKLVGDAIESMKANTDSLRTIQRSLEQIERRLEVLEPPKKRGAGVAGQ